MITALLAERALGISPEMTYYWLEYWTNKRKLQRHVLKYPVHYWTTNRVLGPNKLLIDYGIALYCYGGKTRRERLLRLEQPPGLKLSSEVLCCEGEALQCARLDLGGDSNLLARRARRFAARNRGLDLSHLKYVFLTISATKAKALAQALGRYTYPFQLGVAVLTDSILLELLGGYRNG